MHTFMFSTKILISYPKIVYMYYNYTEKSLGNDF